ncbi:concanavalin A-like lectin/glucanase domain-containing protein [Pyronema omphalodes]|nr:concanavalin A-like lectin/glucanase domain-containing protein [Pyronema omphalodes]
MKLLWSLSLLAIPAVQAVQYHVDTDYSIGARHPISEDHRTLPGFQIFGSPQLLSDRVILTPPAPGNQRVGLWSNTPNPHDEWHLTSEFRANGGERPGGSLHIWYTSRGGMGGTGTESIYTAKPFDGLALVIDSHIGHGSVRGYLNDGSKDFSQHHNPASLAFGHCSFDYRNKGSLSKITMMQSANQLRVDVDGQQCFQTSEAKLPRGYFWGITAATTEQPDSFELFNFILSGPASDLNRPKEQVGQQQQQQPPAQQNYQTQQQHGQQQEPIKRQMKGTGKHMPADKEFERATGKLPHEEDWEEWRPEIYEEDHDASYYKDQASQFADLHNRIQGLTHHLAQLQEQLGMIYDRVDSLHHKEQDARDEQRHSRVLLIPREQIDRMEVRLNVVERIATDIASAVVAKDYSAHFEDLKKTLNEHHSNLLFHVPDTMHQVLASGGPKIWLMVTIVVFVQVALAGGYIIYKKRRNSSPKKYL